MSPRPIKASPEAIAAALARVEPAIAAQDAACKVYDAFVADEKAGRIQVPNGGDRDQIVVDRMMVAQRLLAAGINGKFGDHIFAPDYSVLPAPVAAQGLRTDLNYYCGDRPFTTMRERLRAAQKR